MEKAEYVYKNKKLLLAASMNIVVRFDNIAWFRNTQLFGDRLVVNRPLSMEKILWLLDRNGRLSQPSSDALTKNKRDETRCMVYTQWSLKVG